MRNISMCNEVVELFSLCIKQISMIQYGNLDLDTIMLFLDSTCFYPMVFLWFVSKNTKLTFELCRKTYLVKPEQSLSCIGIVLNTSQPKVEFQHPVHLFTCMICYKGDKWYLTFCDRYIPILKFMLGFRVIYLQFLHVCNVPSAKAFVLYSI